MAMRKGRCTNYDGCSKADKDEILEIDELDDFVCPECGHELEELRAPKKKGGNSLIWIIAGVIVVAGLVLALIFGMGGKGKEDKETSPISDVVQTDSIEESNEAVPNRNDTLVIKIEGQDNMTQVEEIISEDTVDVTTEATMPEAAPDVKVTEESSVHSSSTKAPRSSSPKLSYGTWTGGWKNGNPHGTGTLTYSVSKTIDSRDSKGRIAKPGEYIVGEWDNGHLVQGRWFKKDGTKEVIIIGKVD